MKLTFDAQVRVTDKAIADHQADQSLASQTGRIIDMTADCESAWVYFPQRGSKSFWHHSELYPAA